MDSSQRSQLAAKHYNKGLFADHYLNEVVPTLPQWNDDYEFERIVAIKKDLQALYQSLKPESLDEAQLEERWIKPVLEALGHHWSVQVKIRYRDKGFRKPDYALAATAEAAQSLTNQIYQPDELKNLIAVADAKRWGVTMDQAGKKQDDRNPSQQIDEYLRYSEVRWGILTDGRIWRLYERGSSKNNVFYAVDLPALLAEDKTQDYFFYFYQFFRREAFEPGGWLDRVLKGSSDYAESLSEKLEDEVYVALELIAQGFLDYRRNRLDRHDPTTLQTIYVQSLVLLYRLLFIFYAESRDILPMSDNLAYADNQSLRAIKTQIATLIDHRITELERQVDNASFYEYLSTLFFNIDQGSPEYDIAPYNGRLFSESEHPFLADKSVGNAYLGKAIDRLARVPDSNDHTGRRRVNVDYRDLDVRHLGAIYEKLLEYQLDVATEPLVIRRNKYLPAGDTPPDKSPGQVYLRTGSNERKVTGSYYTPDYIVSFIVQQTIDPLLIEVTERHAELDDEGGWRVHNPQALRAAILNLNILDPATGSGHFLVEVVTHIAGWLTELHLQPDDIERGEDELTYWKRQVVSACIYGVDVNPLAVELAKLSLWLATISRGRPLSFLDHHVRLGNSLVGARAQQLTNSLTPHDEDEQDDKQQPLFDQTAFIDSVGAAVGQMNTIETTIAAAIGDVKQQEKTYDALQTALEPWRMLAHVWTARYFGLDITAQQWQQLYTAITRAEALPTELQKLLDDAQTLHQTYHFLHWDFAFPEIFFDADGKPRPDAGFDAVIGNPPYVRQERIQPYKPFFQHEYQIYSGTADLFLYFYERALTLLRDEQRVGYITSGTFMNSNSAVPFRRYIHQNAAFDTALNFGENQPFKGAEMVYPTIGVLRKGQPQKTFKSLFVEDVYPREQLYEAVEEPFVDTLSEITGMDEWRFQSIELTELFKKVISKEQTTFHDFINGQMYWGIKTGYNAAFYIDDATRNRLLLEDKKSDEIIKPLLRGQDLRPWYQQNSNTFVIFTHHGINIDSYPAIKSYLERYKTRLTPKPDDWKGTWSGRSSGDYTWYELQATPTYYRVFESTKIVWPDITKRPRLSMDDTGSYMDGTGFVAITKQKFLLGLLNSRVLWFVLSQLAIPLRLRAGLWQYRAKAQFMERLPIPELTADQESQLAALAEEITALARERYALHQAMRQTMQSEFRGEDISTRVALYRWWELDDEAALSDEINRRFGQPIPLSKRSEWRGFLTDQKAAHQHLTDQIIAGETRLNAIVYDAFHLTPAERALIESATKYPYGAV